MKIIIKKNQETDDSLSFKIKRVMYHPDGTRVPDGEGIGVDDFMSKELLSVAQGVFEYIISNAKQEAKGA